jgi:integrase
MGLVYRLTIGVAYNPTMEQMNVQEMTNRLKRLYPKIKAPTKVVWDKSIKPIAELQLHEVNDDVAYDYLDKHTDVWSESTLKARIGTLKGLWNKARKKKLYKGDNPWLDLDDGLEIARREPDLHPWEFYEYYHDDPYFVCLWYTGMRIGELAGIYPENIHIDVQIPYFDLKHQENRRLKNDESIRKVPIHPACLTYVDRLYLSKAKSPGQSWSENLFCNVVFR